MMSNYVVKNSVNVWWIKLIKKGELIRKHMETCIYALRVAHGKVHEWYFIRKVNWLRKHVKKENTVVATAFHGKMFSDNPKYIVEKIHELSPETKIVWVCAATANDCMPSYIHTIYFGEGNKLINELIRATVTIGNCRCFDYLDKRWDRLNLDTWHGGLGIKKIGKDTASNKEKKNVRFMPGFDFIISNSDYLSKTYRSAFRNDEPIWKCGYPIEDSLISEDDEKKTIHERYSIPDNVRIVLYVPTYRKQYQWQSKLNCMHVNEALQNRFGEKWVMLVHWHQLMSQKDRRLSDAIDTTEISNMQSLIKAADACITDYSSCIYQAVQRAIPCFLYADDYDAYSQAQGMYLNYDELPFPYAFTNRQLVDNILHYDATMWKEKWEQYAKCMGHIVTGHSAEDVAKVCVDFLNGKPKADIMKEIPFETRF